MLYHLLKIVSIPVHRLFYDKIIIEGQENIPKKGPVIFAPNHQNALMDVMSIITTSKRSPYFLTRADLFENPLYKAFLTLFRARPIYRITDGKESLNKNGDVFEHIIDLLEKKKSIAIFPEATQNDKRQLLGFRKGFVRIALQAEEKNNFKLGVTIVPVGIYYTNYTRFRSALHISYGKPIVVSNIKSLYKANPQKAYNVLKSDTAKRIIPMIINIKNKEYYNTFDRITEIYPEHLAPKLGFKTLTKKNLFLSKQKVVYLLNLLTENKLEEFLSLRLSVDDYYNELSRLKYTNEDINNYQKLPSTIVHSLLLFVTSPLFIIGFIQNIIPYQIPRSYSNKIEDTQFKSSYKFALGTITFSLFYILQLVGLSFILDPIWLGLYAITLPLMGIAAYKWFSSIKNLFTSLKLKKANKNKSGEIYDLIQQRESIIDNLDKLTETYFQ
ncbi:MAG: 1-acyl-sn-glycerol-3-phosphate acyltransferase [Bacteroidota bacterium]|nr:1-acyl-sn-glycerol-3-phosphate acyltransferase [Bacteroidota bacterium]